MLSQGRERRVSFLLFLLISRHRVLSLRLVPPLTLHEGLRGSGLHASLSPKDATLLNHPPKVSPGPPATERVRVPAFCRLDTADLSPSQKSASRGHAFGPIGTHRSARRTRGSPLGIFGFGFNVTQRQTPRVPVTGSHGKLDSNAQQKKTGRRRKKQKKAPREREESGGFRPGSR